MNNERTETNRNMNEIDFSNAINWNVLDSMKDDEIRNLARILGIKTEKEEN